MSSTNIKILCFVDYFEPGYLAGGPIKSISNFVAAFHNHFDIYIVTRNTDLGSKVPYDSVTPDNWLSYNGVQIIYISEDNQTIANIRKLIYFCNPDVLYLNSFFSFRFSLLPLLCRRFFLSPLIPCVIAPRGELSLSALKFKFFMKRAYIYFFKFIGLYKSVIFQSSTPAERFDVQRYFPLPSYITNIACDMPSPPSFHTHFNNKHSAPPPFLRLVFISRITPMKNLDFLLRALSQVKSKCVLDIFGPIEDAQYWSLCSSLISSVPSNVKINFFDKLHPADVPFEFASADLFVFPSRGENYGHVILESLSAGTPVFVSDKTPWVVDHNGGLTVIPLDEYLWSDIIDKYAENLVYARSLRTAAFAYAQRFLNDPEVKLQNKSLFMDAIKLCK